MGSVWTRMWRMRIEWKVIKLKWENVGYILGRKGEIKNVWRKRKGLIDAKKTIKRKLLLKIIYSNNSRLIKCIWLNGFSQYSLIFLIWNFLKL